jgi:hypothetical protein
MAMDGRLGVVRQPVEPTAAAEGDGQDERRAAGQEQAAVIVWHGCQLASFRSFHVASLRIARRKQFFFEKKHQKTFILRGISP